MAWSKLSRVSKKARIARGVKIYDFVNIYGECSIGEGSVIGAFVEIQPGVRIGKRVKISSHSFLCTGVTIEDEAFVGHGVMFINDKLPKSVDGRGRTVTAATTNVIPTVIRKGAAVGSNATVLCGVTVGEHAMIGAGSVVTKSVPARATAYGVPARVKPRRK